MATTISKIKLPARVETHTDAYRVLENHEDVVKYVEEFGFVEVEYEEEYDVYRVPAFAEVIERYTRAKAKDCERWGCE